MYQLIILFNHYINFYDKNIAPNYIKPISFIVSEDLNHHLYCNTITLAIWKHNGKITMPSNVFVRGHNELIINKVTPVNKGIYTCEGSLSNGSLFYANSILEVLGERIIDWIILIIE